MIDTPELRADLERALSPRRDVPHVEGDLASALVRALSSGADVIALVLEHKATPEQADAMARWFHARRGAIILEREAIARLGDKIGRFRTGAELDAAVGEALFQLRYCANCDAGPLSPTRLCPNCRVPSAPQARQERAPEATPPAAPKAPIA